LAFSLLFGAFFAPFIAKASFLSSILGSQVSADASLTDPTQYIENSQTIALLQANVPVLNNGVDGSDDAEIEDNLNADIVSENALSPITALTGTGDGEQVGEPSSDQISVYVVRKGDSISLIADMFDVSVNTILWANDMKRSDTLKENDVLFILPVSGVKHVITKGQTLENIAKLYKVSVYEITQYNGIVENAKLSINDELIIPDAEMNDEGGDKPASNLSVAEARDKNYYASHPIQSLKGYFINPLPTGHKTQGLHGPGKRGIDIGAPTGTPIYASASGTVLLARTGWNGGYGNMVIIQHPNGTKTLYGHMSKLGARTGANVSRGEVIGYVGSTGRSTGPHVHFEVFNAKNPGADNSWAK